MWIVVQAAAGRTRADVEEELYARYGEIDPRARRRPRAFGARRLLDPGRRVRGAAAASSAGSCAARRARAREPQPPARALDPEVERKLDEMLGRDDDEADPR